jgi:hypothetical protein
MPRNRNATYEDAELQEEYSPEESVFLEDIDDDDDDEVFGGEDFDDDDDEAFDDDDDDETTQDMYENDPEFLGTVLTGGLNKIIPGVARAFRKKPRTGKGRKFTRGTRSIRKFSVRTPAGRAQFRLPASVVTKKSFKAALARVGRDIRKNGKAIKSMDKNHKAVISSQSKAFQKKTDSMKNMAMMNLFMQPQLESINIQPRQPGDPASQFRVDPNYEDNNMMLMMMMMGDNGIGGGSNNSTLMALAFSNML